MWWTYKTSNTPSPDGGLCVGTSDSIYVAKVVASQISDTSNLMKHLNVHNTDSEPCDSRLLKAHAMYGLQYILVLYFYLAVRLQKVLTGCYYI